VLLSERTAMLPVEAAAVIAEYVRARDTFAVAHAELQRIIAELRTVIIDGSAELALSATEVALLAVIAIHRGDDEAAYQYARATASATHFAEAAIDVVYTTT